MADKLKSWKELPRGGIITEAGNSIKYNTGDWRVQRPVLDKKKCTNCNMCFIHCPDSTILTDKTTGEMLGMDYEHCKGCGICCEICPVKAIEMKSEKDFIEQ